MRGEWLGFWRRRAGWRGYGRREDGQRVEKVGIVREAIFLFVIRGNGCHSLVVCERSNKRIAALSSWFRE